MPWIGGGGSVMTRASIADEFLRQAAKQRAQIFARIPRLEHNVGDAGIGKRRAVIERGDAGDGDDVIDGFVRAGGVGDLLKRLLRPR